MKIFPSLTFLVTILLLMGWSKPLPSRDSLWNTVFDEQTARDKKKKPTASHTKQSSKSQKQSKLDPIRILRKSHEVLRRHRSFQANMEQEFVIDGRTLNASGNYSHAPGYKMRLEMTVRLGTGKNAVEGSVLQVCDGQVLWTRHQIAGKPRITRRDVRQIASAAESAGLSRDNFLTMNLGLGGLPAYLAALEKCLDFEKASIEVSKVNGVPEEFYVVDGVWNELYRKHFESVDPRTKGFPAHVPDRVRLIFDKEFIPRIVIYAKQKSAGATPERMARLRFDSIKINGSLDENNFRFIPTDGVYQDDITNAYLNQIKTIPKQKK